MSLTIRKIPRVLIQEGSYLATCFAVIDLGIQYSKIYDTHFPKVMLGWELNETAENAGNYVHWQAYTLSLSMEAKLRTLIQCWRGRVLHSDELENFKLATLLGLSCYIIIRHYLNNDQQTWATIDAIQPIPPDKSPLPLQNPIIYFDLDSYTEKDCLSLPEFIRKKINFKLED